MKEFLSPTLSLGDLDAAAVSRLTAASDIALVVGTNGVIRDIAHHNDALAQEIGASGDWLGHHWSNYVTADSRSKVESLLHEAVGNKTFRWLHINHPAPNGTGIPVHYSAVQAGSAGNLILLGRDLRAASALQQRLVDAQQSMERDYLRLRHVETRYRLLFEMSSEAIVIVDAQSQKTTEANPVALHLLGEPATQVLSRPFPDMFDAEGKQTVEAMLGQVKSSGRADEMQAKTIGSGTAVRISASLFRQENALLVLARLVPVTADPAPIALSNTKTTLLMALENAPDAFVVTAADGRILAANTAFLDMVQLAAEDQAREGTLEDWLGRGNVDMNVMVANLRQRGSVRLFATTLRGKYGAHTDVEISAVAVVSDGKTFYGFTIRNVGRRLPAVPSAGRDLPRSVEQLTELIGRVSLKELVREATDIIEKLGIEAALELTDDNKASAAELLGLSRQSLYVKLRRYGLGDLSSESDDQS